jgi:hypothetical protein
MLKRLAALLPLALLAALPAAAAVTLTIDAGLLTDQNGNPISDGGGNPENADLILLIASPTGTFNPAPANGFVSGNNLILGSSTGSVTGAFSMIDADTTPGETLNDLTFNLGYGATGNVATLNSSIVVGDTLAIRWYTDFTLAQFEAGDTPTAGYYGTYTATNLDGGAAWVIPADGSTLTGGLEGPGLQFYTTNDPPGFQDPSFGEALTPVVSGEIAVPEPSTYALLATGLLFVAGMAVRKKRFAVVTK